MTSSLFAGIARADITPPVGIAHANWGAQAHEQAQGVDLPLWATALVIGESETSLENTIALVDLDLIGLPAAHAHTVRQAIATRSGMPLDQIRISYTHTHSGPSMGMSGDWATRGADLLPTYVDNLAAKAAGVVWEALHKRQPVRVAAGRGTCDIGVNRRFITPEGSVVVGHNTDGPVDQALHVVRIDPVDDDPSTDHTSEVKPLAILVNYACHPIIVGPYNDLITPDFPGVTKRVVEAATGATCFFLQGATGDIGPIEGCTSEAPLPIYRRLGTRLGYAALGVALGLQPQPKRERYVRTLESGAPLGVFAYDPIEPGTQRVRAATRTLRLPLKEFASPAETEAEATARADELKRLHAAGAPAEEVRWAGMLAKRSRMRAARSQRYHGQSHTEVEAQAFLINDIALVCVPGEPFTRIGLAIKEQSPFAETLFSGYSNEGGSYVPMPEDYPVGGYEVDVTPFTPDAAGVIVDECIVLLNSLA